MVIKAIDFCSNKFDIARLVCLLLQWNLFVTTTFIIKFITCDLYSNVF